MVNMKMSSPEAQEYLMAEPEKREYPYGLTLQLEEESLAKLGIKDLPAPGTIMTFTAKAVVERVLQSADDKKAERCLSLQITDMAVDGASKPDAAAVMYGG